MTRSEILERLADCGVMVSVDGSTADPLTERLAAQLGHNDKPVRVMDLTVIPGALRAYFGPDGTLNAEGSAA